MANQIKYQVGFDVNTQNLNQLKSSLQEIQKLKISDVMKINNTDYNTADKYLKNIKAQTENVEIALKRAFNAKLGTVNLQQFNSVLKDSGSSINQVYDRFNKAGAAGQAAFRNLASSVLSTNVQIKETHTLLDKMATTLANTIKWNAASSVVNGFSRSIEQAWGYVKALDTSLNDIRIVTGKSSDEMAKFAVQANNAAKELGKTTTDYTNAALIYAQQGLSDEQIQARAAITLKAASVTGQSTDAVSEQLTAVWNGYKVTADEAQLYVDRLAAVAATTASNLQELSTGMSKVASAAAAMGVGQDQLAAQLSTIISVTRQAPESVGTALRTVYARISDIKAGIDEDGVTLGNYSGKMAELGFNVLDVNGNLRDMGEVMEEIGNRWESLTREQQVSLAQTMAGQRQYSNLIALFDNFEKYNKSLAVAQGAAGTLQKQQDIYMDQTAAHLQTLKASMEDVYDSLADTDSINSIIDVLAQLANFSANWIDSLGGGINILKSLGAIGLTVFSQQIAKGINTSINNMQIANQNAEQFRSKLQGIKKMRSDGSGTFDQATDEMLARQRQLYESAKYMSPEQFAGTQKLLNDITALGSEIASIEEKVEPARAALKSLDSDGVSLENVLGNGEKIDQITAEIDKPIDALDDLQQRAKKAKEEFREAFAAMKVASSKSGVEDLDDAFDKAETDIVAFLDVMKEVGESKAFQGLGADAVEEFEKIQQEWKKTTDEIAEIDSSSDIEQKDKIDQKAQVYKEFYDKIVEYAKKASGDTQKHYEALLGMLGSPDSLKRLQEAKAQLDSKMAQFTSGQETLQKMGQIDNYAKMAGGIAQVGSAIRQIQGLGSIWKNADLSGGEKLLQTITNLATSLPMLAMGFTKASLAIGIMTRVTGKAEEALVAKKIIGPLLSVQTEAGKAQLAIKTLNGTLVVGQWAAYAAGIAGVVAILGILINMHKKNLQAEQERLKTQIENEQKIQDEIHNNEQLYSSIEEINQKYKDGQISRLELKSAVQDLIDQYGLQKDIVDNLTGSYSNLTDWIKNASEAAADEEIKSAKRGMKAAKESLMNELGGGSVLTFGNTGLTPNDEIAISIDPTGLKNTPEFKKALQDIGYQIDDRSEAMVFKAEANAKSITELFNKLEQATSKASQIYDEGVLSKVAPYRIIKQELQEISPILDQLNSQEKAFQEGISKKASFKDSINFQQIKNGNQYLEERINFIKEIQNLLDQQENGKDYNAEELADQYLKTNQRNLYTQFDEFAKLAEETKKKLGEDNPLAEEVTNMIGELDEQHFDALMNGLQLSPSVLSSWQLLKQFVEYIANQDLSNIKFTGGSFEENQQAAIDQYGKYQGIQDTVREGKGISAQQFAELDSGLQGFFNKSIDGTYRMQGAAKEFFAAVDSLKLQGFQSVINDINSDLAKVQSLQSGGFDYESLDKNAFQNRDYADIFDRGLINKQLDYLDIVGGKDMETSVQSWRDMVEQGINLRQVSNQVYEAMGRMKDQTKDLDETHEELTEKQIQAYHNLHDAMFPTDSDVDASELARMTQVIQQMSTSSEELDDQLQTNAHDAEDVAEAILRFNDAIKDVTDNYDDWMSELSNPELAKVNGTLEELRDAYADLLDLDGTSLSDDFLESAENLDLMKAAAEGSEDAYNQLMQKAGQDIIAHMSIDKAKFDEDLNTVNSELDAMNFKDLEIGASLDTDGFLGACEQLVNNANMTAQQATDYLASMGVDAEVVQTDTNAEEESEQMEWTDTVTKTPITSKDTVLSGSGDSPHPVTYDTSVTQWDQDVKATPVKGTAKKSNKAFSLKVISANKSSGGKFKYNHASNAGGGGKKGGGGGGGGGGGTKPDTSKKEKKKPLKKTADPYHDVNRDLKKIDRSLQKLTKDQDKLFGKQYIDNLNKQNATLDKSIAKLKEKQRIQKQELKTQRQSLKNLGVIFDKHGNITNYQQILTGKQRELNNLISQRNKLVQKYNKSTDKAYKQGLAAAIKEYDDKIKQGQDALKQLEDGIKQYEDTQNAFGETNDAIDEAEQKKIENNIKKFRYAVELRLDLGEAARDWNEFVRDVLQPTDVLKDNEFDELFGDAKQDFNDLRSYFGDGGLGGSIGSIEKLTSQLKADFAEINQINNTGWSDIYGKDKAQAMEHLKQDWEDLMDQMGQVQQLVKNIDKAYLETIDDIAEQFDKQIEGYDYVNELIQHDIDLLQILYGEESYAAMDNYYTKMLDNQNKQIDSLRKQADFWKEQRDAAIAAGETNAAEKFEENYKRAIQNINSAIEDAANLLKDKYTNTINLIFDELNNKLTNGKGLDYLGQQWEYMQDAADEYLDTVNAAYNLQTLQNKFQKAINNTEGLKNQKALKKLMDEQLANLKAREKLTQYDVDRAEKLLQVEQARIALEQAQSSKTSLRLKRDAQGNYSYQYVADEQGIEDAQQNYLDANNDIYNFDIDAQKQNHNNALTALREYQEKRSQIEIKYRGNDAKRIQQLALLEQAYQNKITDLTQQNLNIRNNLMDSAIQNYALLYNTNVDNYRKMSDDQRDILMHELVPEWDSSIQTMMDKIVEQGGFIPATQDAFERLHKATQDYEKELDQMAKIAGISLDDVAKGTDELTDEFADLVEQNDQLINRMSTELSTIVELKNAADQLMQQYKDVTDAAKDMVTQIQQVIDTEYDQAAAYAETGRAYKKMTDDIYNAAADLQARLNALSAANQPSGDNSNSGGSGTDGTGTGNTTPSPTTTKPTNNFDYYKFKDSQVYQRMATGGYTGDWATDEGRVAMLDKKQLVLNQDDTKNFLNGILILRQIAGNFKGNLQAKIANVKSNFGLFNSSSNDTIEQNVKIEASFPNVNSRQQIEEAFNNLVNLAAQRAMRR